MGTSTMGTSNTTPKGHGARLDGSSAVAFDVHDLSEQTQPMVRVRWTVVREFETEIPRAIWQRLGGVVGPLVGKPDTLPTEGMLIDLEADTQIHGESDVIERVVDSAETVS